MSINIEQTKEAMSGAQRRPTQEAGKFQLGVQCLRAMLLFMAGEYALDGYETLAKAERQRADDDVYLERVVRERQESEARRIARRRIRRAQPRPPISAELQQKMDEAKSHVSQSRGVLREFKCDECFATIPYLPIPRDGIDLCIHCARGDRNG